MLPGVRRIILLAVAAALSFLAAVVSVGAISLAEAGQRLDAMYRSNEGGASVNLSGLRAEVEHIRYVVEMAPLDRSAGKALSRSEVRQSSCRFIREAGRRNPYQIMLRDCPAAMPTGGDPALAELEQAWDQLREVSLAELDADTRTTPSPVQSDRLSAAEQRVTAVIDERSRTQLLASRRERERELSRIHTEYSRYKVMVGVVFATGGLLALGAAGRLLRHRRRVLRAA
ncbi:hypothetical protein AB0J80_33645 [Actinoplanes sp. NPDC049548]|uniref:hypothetical protein n=1 Tax=Actinoplanes sp. NPDC049548 TaxID=3155152 RepID=UPI00341B6C03